MSNSEDLGQGEAEDLSALVDGELAASEVGRVCAQWGHESARSRWHTYHLIGDVLRSGDLSSSPERDHKFLAALRQRLAHEPEVPVPADPAMPPGADPRAPLAALATRPRRALWTSWAAAVAFAALAAGLVATQGPLMQRPPAARTVALVSVTPQDTPAVLPTAAPSAAGPGVPAAASAMSPAGSEQEGEAALSGQLIRDARLDEYLAAHKKFGGSSAPGGPSGFLRPAAVESR